MQITATLSGSTATIATSQNGISTALTIKDATNLATDLAAFTDPAAPSVDASTFTTSGTIPPTSGADMTGTTPAMAHGGMPLDAPNRRSWDPVGNASGLADFTPDFTQGGQRNRDFQVHSRGYLLDATDEGVRITDPATNGKMAIPRDRIAAVIAGLNA